VAGGFRRFTRAAWWVHVLATLAAVALLALVALAVAAVLYVDFVREHGPLASEIPPQAAVDEDEWVELAQRFTPVLKFHSQELFVPIPRAAYVSRTQLKEQEGRFARVLNSAPSEEKLPTKEGACLRRRGCLYFLDVRGVEPDPPKHSQSAYDPLENELLRTGAKPTVYAHVTRYEDSGDYGIQYWFLYFFNFRLNEHESDWEQITIRLNADKEPVGAYYSAHEGGSARDWKELDKEVDHPVVYVALGSHANYYRPGRHPVSVGCRRVIGSFTRCFHGRRLLVDVADGRGRTLGEGDYALSALAGPVYVGSYGSGNYVVLTRKPDVLADPRTRTAWKDPLRPFR
jgi:Vacuolar protein sorting-associated protein 62